MTLKEIIAEVDRLAKVAARFDLFKLEERLAAVAANLNDIVEEEAAAAEDRKEMNERIWQSGRQGLVEDMDKAFELPPAQPVPAKEEESTMPGTGFAGRSLVVWGDVMAIIDFRTSDGCYSTIEGAPEELAEEFVNRMGYGAENWDRVSVSADGVVTAMLTGVTAAELYRLAGGQVYSAHPYSPEELGWEIERLLAAGNEIVDITRLPPKPMSYIQPELGDLPAAYEVRYRSKT